MKKIVTTITVLAFVFSMLFFNIEKVEADYVQQTKLSYECIYSDGSLFTLTNPKTDEDDEYIWYQTVINRDSYNVKGSQSQQSASTGAIVFVNIDSMIGETHHCSPYVIVGQVKSNEYDDEESPTSYVKFSFSKGSKFVDGEIDQGDSGWWFWSKKGEDQANKHLTEGQLKSESIKIDGVDPDDVVYFKKDNGTTADGNEKSQGDDSYIVIGKYRDKYGDFVVAESDSITTVVDFNFDTLKNMDYNSTIYVNDPSRITVTSTTGNSQYDYAYPRYEICTSKDYSKGCVIKYKKVQDAPDPKDQDDGELCEKIMPETSKVLRNIIKLLQLLVPLLLIVLCGLDLAKVVFTSAKIEEEIPKQRKRIIVRMIVAAFFFFTPLIVNLTIDILKDSGGQNMDQIKKIGCLFE